MTDCVPRFWWEGKLDKANELLLVSYGVSLDRRIIIIFCQVAKSRTDRFSELCAIVKDNHPYDTPEVIAQKVEYICFQCDRSLHFLQK